jgi:hypothetical protein
MIMDQSKRLVCLLMTEEQEEVLEGIFTFHGWDFERVEPGNIQGHLPIETQGETDHEPAQGDTDHEHAQGDTDHEHAQGDTDHEHAQVTASDNEPVPCDNSSISTPLPIHNGNDTECTNCFSDPCITHEQNRQETWPSRNALPNKKNSVEMQNV